MSKKATKKPGRPKGVKNLVSKDISVITTSHFSRKQGSPGLKRAVLMTSDEANALALERLVHMLNKKDRRLLSVIKPPVKKASKKIKKETSIA